MSDEKKQRVARSESEDEGDCWQNLVNGIVNGTHVAEDTVQEEQCALVMPAGIDGDLELPAEDVGHEGDDNMCCSRRCLTSLPQA